MPAISKTPWNILIMNASDATFRAHGRRENQAFNANARRTPPSRDVKVRQQVNAQKSLSMGYRPLGEPERKKTG